MKQIPKNNVVVMMIGPSGAGKSTFCKKYFQEQEVTSLDSIRERIAGDVRRQDKNKYAAKIQQKIIDSRLKYGLRIVIDNTNLHPAYRKDMVNNAKKFGAKVIYVVVNRPLQEKISTNDKEWRINVKIGGVSLLKSHDERFIKNKKSILSGDNGLADLVINTQIDKFNVEDNSDDYYYTVPFELVKMKMYHHKGNWLNVSPLEMTNFLIQNGFEKIRVIGDVHGNLEGLKKSIDVDPKTFLLFLGDVVDYGVDTLEVVNVITPLIEQGRAVTLRGNHERKIYNYIMQERFDGGFRGCLSHGNDITISQLKNLSDEDRMTWELRFTYLVDMSYDHIILTDEDHSWMFVHAAGSMDLWTNDMHRMHPNTPLENRVLFGDPVKDFKGNTMTDDNGYLIRNDSWIDEFDSDQTVVVGHSVVSVHNPVIKNGKNGAKAIFLDTGSSKKHPETGENGHLSWMDLKIGNIGKQVTVTFDKFGR